jgi:hypothetical protein
MSDLLFILGCGCLAAVVLELVVDIVHFILEGHPNE